MKALQQIVLHKTYAKLFESEKLMGEGSLNCLLDVYRMDNLRLAQTYVTQNYTDGARAKYIQY